MQNTLRRASLATGLAALAFFSAPAPALARGPDAYIVEGRNPGGNGGYSGSATLTQTGEHTWRLVWRIGGQSWEGWGIGDGKVIAVNYRSGGTTGVILMIEREGGGYESIWANSGSSDIGTETWIRR